MKTCSNLLRTYGNTAFSENSYQHGVITECEAVLKAEANRSVCCLELGKKQLHVLKSNENKL